jgi:hypothetical protein
MIAAYFQARVSVNRESDSACVRGLNRFRRAPLPVHALLFAVAFYYLSRHKDWEKSQFYLVFEFIGGPLFNCNHPPPPPPPFSLSLPLLL